MNKYTFVLYILFLSAIRLSGQESFRINGIINSDYNGAYIRLFQFQGDSLITSIDSVRVNDGKFHFEGLENLGDLAVITTKNRGKVKSLEVILEKGETVAYMDTALFAYGTPLNDLFNRLRQRTEMAYAAYAENKVYRNIDSVLCNIMRENYSNVVGRRFIETYKNSLTYDSCVSVYDFLESKCPGNPWLTSEFLAEREELQKAYMKQLEMVQDKFIDFELETPEGERKRISDFVGQSEYLFIDFWASWCGPCVREIPGLKKVYKKYKDKGVEILSVSIDYNRKHWVNALAKYNMSWMQLATLEQGSDELQNAYGFKGIPYGILLNKDGEIVAVAGTWEILEKELVDLLPVDEIIK